MNVSLTPELERRIAERVEFGLYTTASEVVRESLRLLFEADEIKAQRLERLQADIQIGLDEVERGETVDGGSYMSGLRQRIEARPKG